MRPVAWILAADDFLLDAAERAYLWLFDRTGIPKGALIAVLGAASTLAAYFAGTFTWPFTLAMLAGCGVMGLATMAMQTLGTSEAVRASLDAGLDDIRKAMWRRLLYPPYSVGFVGFAFLQRWKGHDDWAWSLVLPVICYLALARTRDRKPPPRRKPADVRFEDPAAEAAA